MRTPSGETLRGRVRTSGVVTRRLSDTVFFLRGDGRGLKVETRQPTTFQPGDRVDAAGFPEMSEGLAVLQQTVARRLDTQPAPAPVNAAMPALLDGSHNSDLVAIRARLVDWSATGPSVTLIFQAGDHLFKGLLNQLRLRDVESLRQHAHLIEQSIGE